ncbi:metallophosphoesterase family protein [Methanosarcina mazei]|uniref:DNA double-strand break repair protein Mre11 n=1 Tax=Methanosarcina mazei S-6 TaxID=213585 RepID=A0A0E3RI41_METMZ|nr:exonuclease SbcCD subunit D [Methanosarcina mazei]AKB65689.1 DNA double-strand break repair protein Mre11 [Methanosarcina mazei S-6]
MDREIRILHTADTHLGYRQYHSEVRRQDFFKAFETVIKDAVDMQVDAVVHAGDLFDSRNPTLEDLLETMNVLSRLKVANIPFFGIVGNHESKQSTQWLDLFEEMGLAGRLGKAPKMVGDVAIYGIDSVPKSKIPLFDYSGFEIPESLPENCRKLLVMHQIMQPSPFPDWDCAEVIENLPFKADAVLLGDYHEYEKIKVGESWVTYSGSTERNSASEKEPRSYSIITLSGEGLEISRRTIPTRNFLFITAKVDGEEKPFEQIFSAVNEHLEEIPESVVFLDVSGDSGSVLSFSEIEEYLLSKGALVAKVKDARIKDGIPEEVIKVAFHDPDRAVAEELRRMSLNDGGLIVDEVIRSPDVPRSRVDEETENRLLGLIEAIDFKDPDFMIKIPVSHVSPVDPSSSVSSIESSGSVSSIESSGSVSPIDSVSTVSPSSPSSSAIIKEPEELKPPGAAEEIENPKPAGVIEFTAAVAAKSETLRVPVRIQRSESLNESLNKIFEKHDVVPESPETAGSIAGSVETAAEDEISKVTPDSGVITAPQSSSPVSFSDNSQAGFSAISPPESIPSPEILKENSEADADEKPVDGKLSEEKPVGVPDKATKTVKQSHRKGKEKSAVPRQYNLGDYL